MINPITGEAETPRKRGRPLKHPLTEQSLKSPTQKQNVLAGVSVLWLAEAFRMDPKTVRKRLAECPPVSTTKQGPRYALSQAAAYLVKPIFDVDSYLKKMKPEELPPQLQDTYWAALLKRQKWEENAGELWRSDKVREVFAEVFMLMKSTMTLWTEDLERGVGLSPDQRTALIQQIDGLQNELHKLLLEGRAGETITSSMEEIEIDDKPFKSDGSELV